jgi:hypothetical protein
MRQDITISSFITGASPGNQLSDQMLQSMSFHITATGATNAIQSASVATLTKPIGTSGQADLSLTLVQYLNGDTSYEIYATDDGGTANNGLDESAKLSFTVSVLSVNNQPSFTTEFTEVLAVVVPEDKVLAPQATLVDFITSHSVGPADEAATQTFTYVLSYVSGESGLFESVPTVGSDNGKLSMVLKRYMYGKAVYSVSMRACACVC